MPTPPFYITTAIAYVNGAPHIGHALEFVEADCIARYHRLLGDDVYYLTGTDEHGSKIVQTAEKLGMGVKELVDQNAQKFKDMMAQYQIQYDQFIRTSDKKIHWPSVRKLWKKMADKGDIFKGSYKGLYCVGCEEYKNEKDLVNGLCPNHDKAPELAEQENYFFKLSKYSDQVAEILKSGKVKIFPQFRANEIISMCESGLEDVSFSRPKEQLSWGIPVPDDDSQVMYVWCDALTNYISALDYAKNGRLFKKFWPVDCHVIGKDILRFHAGVWIGMLLSADVPLPKAELIHGWIHFQGGRMSKSRGNVVDPVELAKHYGVDAVRYYLLSEIPVGQDGNFSYELFENKIIADLSNNLGNFVNRVFSMTEKYLQNRVPGQKQVIPSELDDFWQKYHAAMAVFDHQKASQAMIALVDLGNRLIADSKPWELAKDLLELEGGSEAGSLNTETDNYVELEKLMRLLQKFVLHLAFMLEPFCPGKGLEIMGSFGLEKYLNAEGLELLMENKLLEKSKLIKKGGLLFERIEEDRSRIDKDEMAEPEKPKSLLLIGQIVSHKKHEQKQHISICKVDIGTGIKNIVCAAENVADGLKVIVALPGFEMLEYNGSGKIAYTVEERKTYGTVSEAVICAPEEIGIRELDPDRQGLIVIIDESVPPGTPYEEVKDKVISN